MVHPDVLAQEREEAERRASREFSAMVRGIARKNVISTGPSSAPANPGMAALAELHAARAAGDPIRVAAAEATLDHAVNAARAAATQQRPKRQPIWPAGAQPPEPPDEFSQFEDLLRRKIAGVA